MNCENTLPLGHTRESTLKRWQDVGQASTNSEASKDGVYVGEDTEDSEDTEDTDNEAEDGNMLPEEEDEPHLEISTSVRAGSAKLGRTRWSEGLGPCQVVAASNNDVGHDSELSPAPQKGRPGARNSRAGSAGSAGRRPLRPPVEITQPGGLAAPAGLMTQASNLAAGLAAGAYTHILPQQDAGEATGRLSPLQGQPPSASTTPDVSVAPDVTVSSEEAPIPLCHFASMNYLPAQDPNTNSLNNKATVSLGVKVRVTHTPAARSQQPRRKGRRARATPRPRCY